MKKKKKDTILDNKKRTKKNIVYMKKMTPNMRYEEKGKISEKVDEEINAYEENE